MVRKKDDVMMIDGYALADEAVDGAVLVDDELVVLGEIDEVPNQSVEQDEYVQVQQETDWFETDVISKEPPIVMTEEIEPDAVLPEPEIEEQSENPTETARPRRRNRHVNQVLAIDDETKIKSMEEAENQLWLELRNAQRGRRILSGTLSGIERLENGLPMAIVYYKETRVAIPATEMMLHIVTQDNQTDQEIYNRYAQLLSRMLAAEIDFVIAGLDRREGIVLGSRKQAMERKQQRYYLNPASDGQYRINEGQIVEARVMVVSEKLLRLEVFGMETTVAARDIAWEWIEDTHDFYQVGDRVLVRVKEIQRDDPQRLRVAVSVREATENPSAANLKKCTVNGKYIGTVTGVEHVVYVRLNTGVNAIATTIRDPRAVCRKDEVSFVVTRIDEANGLAVGIITRIIKQAN